MAADEQPGLVEFLRARLDEDERDATGDAEYSSIPAVVRYARRMLADVEAKRQLIKLHPAGSWGTDEGEPFRRCGGEEWVEWPCRTLRLLALPYASHPDYREEWKP